MTNYFVWDKGEKFTEQVIIEKNVTNIVQADSPEEAARKYAEVWAESGSGAYSDPYQVWVLTEVHAMDLRKIGWPPGNETLLDNHAKNAARFYSCYAHTEWNVEQEK